MHQKLEESWELVGKALSRAVENLDRSPVTAKAAQSLNGWTYFQGSKVPEISIQDYFARIHYYTQCSDSCFVLAFIYVDRILQKNPQLSLSCYNVHR